MDIINGDTIPMNLTALSCFANTIDITPPSFVGRAPSVYRVILQGVKDIYDNPAAKYRWVFVVGDFNFEEAACLPELIISNNNLNQDAISVSAYRALKIVTDGIIPDFGETSLTEQEDITFGAGFTVNSGGNLIAVIEDCDIPITCGEISSPVGIGNAPDETLRFEIVQNANCIDGIFFEDNPLTTDGMIEVKNFTTINDPNKVNVSLVLTRPLGAGEETTSVDLILNNPQSTTFIGTYEALNGKSFSTSVKLIYYSENINGIINHLVSAQVIMTPLVIN